MKRSQMIALTMLTSGLGLALTVGAGAAEPVVKPGHLAPALPSAATETAWLTANNEGKTKLKDQDGVKQLGLASLGTGSQANSATSAANSATGTVVTGRSHESAAAEDAQPSPWRPGTRGEKVLPEVVFPGASPCEGKDLLYRRHVDATYATYENGKLALKVVDGSDVRDSSEVCIHLPADGASRSFGGIQTGDEISRMVVPDDPDWRFLGNPGAIVWKAPQTYLDAGPVWAGIGAFDSAHEWKVPTDIDDNLVTLKLVQVETPSQQILRPGQNSGSEQLNLYIENFEKPSVNAISTNLGIWEYRAAVKAHTHITWTFSAPGYWKLQWVASAKIKGKEITSAPMEQLWAVGTNRDLLWKENRLPGTYPINRSAEEIRTAMGLTAPADNGFDYHGSSSAGNGYELAEQCEKLAAPTQPLPYGQALNYPVAKYQQYLKEELFGWGASPEPFPIQGFHWAFWTDPQAYSPYGMRGRLFNEKASAEEKAEVLQPLGPDGFESESENSYQGYDSKVILVPDKYLTSYQRGVFDQTGAWKSLTEQDTVYAFDARFPGDPKVVLELLPDQERGLQNANVYIDGLSTGNYLGNETAQPALGEFTVDEQGQERWVMRASGLESNRTTFTLKPGEPLPLSLLFAKPGAATINITVTPNYAQEQQIAPLQMEWKFIVGNQAIRQFYQEKGEEIPAAYAEDGSARPSPDFLSRYRLDLQAYQAKLQQCAKGNPEKNPQNGSGKAPNASDKTPGQNPPGGGSGNSGGSGDSAGLGKKNPQTGDGQAERSPETGNKNSDTNLGGTSGAKTPAGSSGTGFNAAQLATLTGGSLLTQWNPGTSLNGAVPPPPAASESGTKTLELKRGSDQSGSKELQVPQAAKQVTNSGGISPWAYLLLGAGALAALAGVGLLGYAFGLSRKNSSRA